MAAEDGELREVLDLSNQAIKKINKAEANDAQSVSTLVLDGNELQRFDNIESYPNLQKLSAQNNQMMRMYGISRLHHIHTLNLSHNCILSIEGLKEMLHLRWLCLAANKIKTIEHLHTNVNLEHLDLSENNIAHVSDLSFLKELSHLYLHGNRIAQLRQCERFLPTSIEVLTLAFNKLTDLNEVSHLSHLSALRDITIANNPCVDMTGNECIEFDYRPFMINWCIGLKVIDGFVINPIESLKAEWLYSQGRGRQFRVGEHAQLAEYLCSVCPPSHECSLESDEERKLQLILSKAQHHRQQLEQQQTDVGRGRATNVFNRSVSSPAPSPAGRRRVNSANSIMRHNSPSPRRTSMSSRLPVTDRTPQSDRMASSFHSSNMASSFHSSNMASSFHSSNMASSFHSSNMASSLHSGNMASSLHSGNMDTGGDVSLMTRSLDPFLLFNSANKEPESSVLLVDDFSLSDTSSGALPGASKLVPVPETLMSPEYRQPAVPKPRPASATNAKRSPKPARTATAGRPKSGPPPAKTSKPPPSPPQNPSSDEDSEYSTSRLDLILQRAQQLREKSTGATLERSNSSGTKSNDSTELPAAAADVSTVTAALCIQRHWRGYRTRNLDRKVICSIQALQMTRTNEYIQQLSSNMEQTIAALENERKLQVLQMQAINALWKKVSGQPLEEGQGIVSLTQTCSQLHNQVSQLQESMNGVIQRIDVFCRSGAEAASTQTDIIAVHTPQSDETVCFPYQRPLPRPSSLPLPGHATEEVQQFATSLVDGVLKTVASCEGEGEKPQQQLTNGNGAAPCGRGEMLSLEENSSSIMILKQPPSSLNTPMESDQPCGVNNQENGNNAI